MSSSIAQPADGFGLAWSDQLRQIAATWQVRVVLACGLGAALLAVGWAFVFPGRWAASQSLVVRDDLLGESFKPGRFNSPESLKSAQETILHIARKPQVIHDALLAAGLSAGSLDASTIEDWQQLISVIAPNGNEFGKTEVFVLKVRGRSPEQATRVVNALTTETENHLRQYRCRLLESMESELAGSLEQASRQYDELAKRVGEIERGVGAELPALRAMIESNSMGSDLQHALEQVRTEIRTGAAELERAERQRDLLRLAATEDAGEFVSTSSDLIELQPVLKRLVDGLVDARLALSAAMGKYSEGHPAISNARASVSETSAALRNELVATTAGLEMQIAMYSQKLARLSRSEADYAERLIELGKLRVEYKSLIDEMTRRSDSLTKSRTDLAEIQSLAGASSSVNLITRVGEPQLASRADGMSKRAMALAGLIAGLLGGLGIVILNPGPLPAPRWLARFSVSRKANPAIDPTSARSVAPPTAETSSSPRKSRPAGDGGLTPKPAARPAAALKELDSGSEPARNYGSGRVTTDGPAKSAPAGSATKPAQAAAAPATATPAIPEVVFVPVATPSAQSAAVGKTDSEKPAASSPEKPAIIPVPAGAAETVRVRGNTAETAPFKPAAAQVPTPAAKPNPAVVAGPSASTSPPPANKPGLIVEGDKGSRPGEAGRSALRDALAASRAELPSRIAPTLQVNTPAPPSTGERSAEPAKQTPEPPTASAAPRVSAPTAAAFSSPTISLDQLRIEEIRRQILELDPGFSLDAFCEPVKKDPDQATPPA